MPHRHLFRVTIVYTADDRAFTNTIPARSGEEASYELLEFYTQELGTYPEHLEVVECVQLLDY